MERLVKEEIGGFLETPLWLQIWGQKTGHIIAFSLFLILIILVMLFKDRIAGKRGLLNILRYGIWGIAFAYVGLVLKAQPTTTNIIIILNSLKELSFPLGLFLLEPYIFLSFVFIFLTLIIWGRGVFCGWLCPYGAMTELLSRIYERLLPKFRFSLPGNVHWRLVYLKYIIFFLIFGVSLYSFILSEYMTEVEPFRTFVLKLNRQWYFIAYFVLITGGSVILYRAFCRYLCPLGAALAIPSFIKWIPLVKMRRYDFCSNCKICTRACRPEAITANGLILSRECLNCLDCQVNFWDEDVCPVLIRDKRLREKGGSTATVSALIIVFLSALIFIPPSADARTIVVGVDYPGITEALKAARDNDVIEVQGGEYRERIVIDREVRLRGIDSPVIKADKGHLVRIKSSRVILEGFTLTYDNATPGPTDAAVYIEKGARGVVVRNNHLLNVMFGVWNVEGSDVMIMNNTIEGLKGLNTEYRGNCINLTGSQRVHVVDNKLSNCRDGIYMELSHDAKVVGNEVEGSRYSLHTMWVDRGVFNANTVHDNLVGLAIMYTDYSEIRDNLSYGNRTHGILFIQSVRSEITGNTVIGNTKGIFLYNSVYNRIGKNLIMNNQLGIHSWGGSQDNTINGNTFINNEIQVKFVASKNQTWDNNYWSDYIGWDLTGDGMGDFPYETNSVIDHIFWRYPVAKVLFTSPALHLLWMLEKQFPVLKVPRVVDGSPSMVPLRTDWRELKERYAAYTPERIYGEIEKIPHLPGGGF